MNYFNICKDNYKTAALAINLFILFIMTIPITAQSIMDSCYTVPKADGLLIRLSKVDGEETVVGALGVNQVQAIAFSANADTLYAANAGRMGQINLNTGAFTPLSKDYGSGNGSLGLLAFIQIEGLTFDGASNTLFGSVKIEDTDDVLIKINPQTGAHIPDAFGAGIDYVTISGSGIFPIVEDLAINPINGEMFALSRETPGNDLLITIDKSTGVSKVVGPLGVDIIEGLGFDNEGRLFATPGAQTSPPQRFYEIDLMIGAASEIAVLTKSNDYESCDCLTAPVGNTNPIAGDDRFSTNVDSILIVNAPGVLSNDSDPDGDDLEIIAFDSTSVSGGTVDLNPDGGFTYTPFNGFEGDDNFNYVISDGRGGTDTASVDVAVIKGAINPVANDDVYSTSKNTELTIDAPGVLENDTDPNGDPLTVVSYDASSTEGTVVVNPDGSFTFIPAIDSLNTDTFTYIVSDGNGNTDTAMVSINIRDPRVGSDGNSPPIAEDDSVMTDLDLEIVVLDPAEGILVNDSDPDGDNIAALEVTDVITDQGGRISIKSDGTFSYTPNLGFVGVDTYEYTVCDDQDPQLCDSALIYLEVKELPVKVFNAFSPNDDGRNDSWVIQGITRFPNNVVQIFNRWGNLIFEAKGYDNTTKVWKGESTEGIVFGNNEVPDGAYFYVIDLGDGSKRLSGYVVIRRG